MAREEEQRRKMILDAVAHCVAEEGIEGATVRRIAERANVSTGMLTYYYANKKEMIAAALDTAGAHLRERIDSVAGPEPSERRLEALFQLMFVDRDEETRSWPFWVEYWATATRERNFGRESALFSGMLENMARWVKAGIDDGYFPPETDPAQAANFLHALMIGLGLTSSVREMRPAECQAIAMKAIALLRAGAGVEGRA